MKAAVNGMSDKMMAFHRHMDVYGDYACDVVPEDLSLAANTEKKVPREWINEAGNGVTQEFVDYVLPLIQGTPNLPLENGLPRFARLKRIVVK